MRTKKRLEAICKLIDEENLQIADIGTDHGYLAKMLINEGKAKKVIATDISVGSLQKAVDLAKELGLENKIETRLGDGLSVIEKNEVDLVIIAGMGGREICKILEKGKDKNIKYFIFQPVQNADVLRAYLIDNFFTITRDFIVKDQNKFYNTIEARAFASVKQVLSHEEIKFGLTNFDLYQKDFDEFLKDKKEKIVEILKENKSQKLLRELEEIDSIIERRKLCKKL